ncbi:MAG: PD-(D/E)XK motif protein [Nitrospirota bacterium]|nr:PD-(D/E)XK motif protein [Nitrospirota bacterium]
MKNNLIKNTRTYKRNPRHVHWEIFSDRIEEGVPYLERIPGEPRVDTFIDTSGTRIGVRIYSLPKVMPVSPLGEVSIIRKEISSRNVVEISTSNCQLFREFYNLVRDIADRVQVDKQDVGSAIIKTLHAWASLLQKLSILSDERQIGLLGELWFLDYLARRSGWSTAADAWKGPGAEEHDFTLARTDIEVKSTLKEKRIHQIGSLTQAVPKKGRQLYILSIQFTPAPAPEGRTLAAAVSAILSVSAKKSPSASALIEERLFSCGWREEHASHYIDSYTLRTPPSLIPVDKKFPAITADTLNTLGSDLIQRIDRVSYGVNLEGMGILSTHSSFNAKLV